jgi:dipeptidyl-peptidase 4
MKRSRYAKICFCWIILALTARFTSGAQVPADAEARLRAVYERGELNAKSFRGTWLPDGSGYTILEPGPSAAAYPNARDIVVYAATDGKKTVLVPASRLVPAGAEKPLEIEAYLVAPYGGLVLIETNGRADGDSERRIADWWIFVPATKGIRKVAEGISPGLSGGSISPDGTRICGVLRADLYVFRLDASAEPVRLTFDGVLGTVGHGQASWSPDGRSVAFVRTDSSSVLERPMLLPTDPSYPKIRTVRFARVGTPIPVLRVGVVPSGGGETKWIALPSPAAGFYLGEVAWAAGSAELYVEWLSRGRDIRDILLADVKSATVRSIFRETDPAWVDASYRANAVVEWIRGGKAAVILSEKDGWRRAYVVSRSGAVERALTPAGQDIIVRARVDEPSGYFYCYASPENATQKYLYRVRLDGSGEPERVTPADQVGTHTYDFSPDGRWAFHTSSTFDRPPSIELIGLPDHRRVRILEDNAALRGKLASWIHRPTEFFKLDIGAGVVMDAWMIKPRDFDPGRKYPVFVFVYGEPHAQTVLDDWGGGQGHTQFHRVIADLGYIVVSIDNRGTPSPKGAAWRRVIYPSLGPLSTEEQAAGVRELCRTRPYADASRVGIWGWSGGGSNTLNAMFRKPDVYKVGIAVAPKPRPELYNAWFQEIFMRTPEENPEGYAKSAPINFASGLLGDLLIVHGTGETNTHVQITEGLVDRLIELGKSFDYMSYPNRDHGLREGKGTAVHLRLLMARYLLEHLPAGPR